MDSNSTIRRGIALWRRKQIGFLLLLAAMLFGSAGRWDWALGWLQFGLYVLSVTAQAVILIRRNPELIAERSKVQKGSQAWDVVITSIAVVLMPMATWITAGLDARYGWSAPFPWSLVVGAVAVWALSYAAVLWAMASNPFFSATIRIQKDRGQRVADGGPYRYLRHPGYAGAILFQLVTPLTLGSWWAFIPSAIAVILLIVRTALEDRVLQTKLDGYKAYTDRVRYRLLPGLW